jgi:hypothetical protein
MLFSNRAKTGAAAPVLIDGYNISYSLMLFIVIRHWSVGEPILEVFGPRSS